MAHTHHFNIQNFLFSYIVCIVCIKFSTFTPLPISGFPFPISLNSSARTMTKPINTVCLLLNKLKYQPENQQNHLDLIVRRSEFIRLFCIKLILIRHFACRSLSSILISYHFLNLIFLFFENFGQTKIGQ